ncbi:MAG TPA: UxaA family hydrolase, partial [Oceanobacillus sp.]|nr:UxaA family hydrolase [Oceanobacillus sp.]
MSLNPNINFVEMSPSGIVPLESVAIRLHPQDNVAIAKTNLQTGTTLALADGSQVAIQGFIPSGHKIALRQTATGEAVYRYGQIIGFATQPIQPGEQVHSHNLSVQDYARDYAFSTNVIPVEYVPEHERRTFMGYRRADGRVGTRNYVGVISTVNCSAHTIREIAHHFTKERLADFPNIDGVIPLAHLSGCANQIGGASYRMLQRTLAGFARHPNIGAYIIVGLGCETNQVSDLVASYDLANGHMPLPMLTIQETGGIRKTVQAGIEAIEELLPYVNSAERTPVPISELMVALQCGGSDGWSGVTANPVLGMVSDEIVRQGGTVVLAETPEIYGAEHLLT